MTQTTHRSAGQSIRFCFIGDSITAGTGDRTGRGWVDRVAGGLRDDGAIVTAYNLGVRGDTSREIRIRWHRESERRLRTTDASGLVFGLGLNDCVRVGGRRRRVGRTRSAANYEAIIRQASGWRPTLVVGPCPVVDNFALAPEPGASPNTISNAELAEANVELRRVASEAGGGFVDLFSVLFGDSRWSEELIRNDGLHPTATAYGRIAEIIAASPAWSAFLLALSRDVP